jgi:hypothetical protein
MSPQKTRRTDSGPDTFAEPGADWLPLHRAPFYFFPDYAPPGKPYAREMRRLLELHSGEQQFKIEQPDGTSHIVEATIGNVRLIVDGYLGGFALRPSDPSNDDLEVTTEMFGPVGLPAAFFESCAQAEYHPDFKASAKPLAVYADRLWQALQNRFAWALSNGSAQVYGRWRDIQEPFSRVFADQWPLFTAVTNENVQDDFTGDRFAQTSLEWPEHDLVIYSACIRPHRVQAVLTTKVETECKLLLIEAMKNDPHRTLTRSTLLKLARQHWNSKQLAERAFDKIRNEVISAVGATGYNKRGPRPK